MTDTVAARPSTSVIPSGQPGGDVPPAPPAEVGAELGAKVGAAAGEVAGAAVGAAAGAAVGGKVAGHRDLLARVFDVFGFHGAATEAQRGADGVRDAFDSQPTPERGFVVAAARAVGANVRTQFAAMGDLFGLHVKAAARGANGAVEAGRSYVDTGRRVVERSIDTERENASQVADAVGNVGSTWVRNQQQTARDVRDAWEEQPTLERKLAVGGFRMVEGNVRTMVGQQLAAANVVKEVGESAVRNAVTGAQNVADVATAPLRAAGSFLGGLFGG